MADTITTSANLGIGVEFQDGNDTRSSTITIPNFRDSITEEQVKTSFTNQQVLAYGYDEQTGAPKLINSDNIVTAATTKQTIENLDIGWED